MFDFFKKRRERRRKEEALFTKRMVDLSNEVMNWVCDNPNKRAWVVAMRAVCLYYLSHGTDAKETEAFWRELMETHSSGETPNE